MNDGHFVRIVVVVAAVNLPRARRVRPWFVVNKWPVSIEARRRWKTKRPSSIDRPLAPVAVDE